MRTQSSLAVSDRIQFHRQQPRTVGTRCLVHQALRCMLDMCLSRHAAASALLSKSDRSLQKNCSECVTAPPRNSPSFSIQNPSRQSQPCMAEPRTPSNNRGQHAAVHYRGARARQLPLILPTHHPLGTRQHVNIKPSVVRYRIRVLRLKG